MQKLIVMFYSVKDAFDMLHLTYRETTNLRGQLWVVVMMPNIVIQGDTNV